MAGGGAGRIATVGVVEHGNSAVLVTVAPDGGLLDRHRIELTGRAEARGWWVCWYDRERVLREAAAALDREDIDALAHGSPCRP